MKNLNKKDIQLFVKSYDYSKIFLGFSKEDYAYLKEKGYIIDKFTKQHNLFSDSLLEEYKKCSKEKVVTSFLSSLVTHDLSYRVGLASYAIMIHYEAHKYECDNIEKFTESTYDYLSHGGCKICGVPFVEKILPTVLNFSFFKGFNASDYSHVYWYLKKTNFLDGQTLCKDSIQIFSDIMDTIVDSDEDDTPIKVQRKIRTVKKFKSNENERRQLLDTLGYLSILETKEHKGFLTRYNKLGHTPSKTHSSDWAYPVDFWTGRDGINKEAFKFWFGEYRELERFWK